MSELRNEVSQLQSKLAERIAENHFLRSSNSGLRAENDEQLQLIEQLKASLAELRGVNSKLEKTSAQQASAKEKELTELREKLTAANDKLAKIDEDNESLLEPPAKKPYHELKSTQRVVVHQQIRGKFGPKLDRFVNKRKLEASHVIFNDVDGVKSQVRVNFQHHRTFEKLTPFEKERVRVVSDTNSIHLTSEGTYLSHRRIVSELPPLAHLRQHNKIVIASLPQPRAAPMRDGAFVQMIPEIKTQLEFLHEMGGVNLSEEVFIQPGIDAAKLTNTSSICVYSVKTISSMTDIGIIGCVIGGDGYKDMDEAGGPFFEQVKQLARNPFIQTKFGVVPVKIRIGGDLVNMNEQLGLSKASCNHPCPACTLHKDNFVTTSYNPHLRDACNGSALARSRASIMNEAIKSSPDKGVKHLPLTPIPLDPNGLILDSIVFDVLHMRIRLTSTYSFYCCFVHSEP